MNAIKSNLVYWFSGCALIFTLVQVIVSQHFEIRNLYQQQKISDEAQKLSDDQINELNYTVYRLTTEKESEATRQFILGVVEAIKNKDHYSAIWHEGYNAGGRVAEYATEHMAQKDQ